MKIDLRYITSEEFEFVCEEILRAKGFTIEARPARGPDGGKDLIAIRSFNDDMGLTHKEKWIVECKHFAKKNNSVKESDIGNVETRMKVHRANRYLLITSSTSVSETVKNQLQAISEDGFSGRMACFWCKSDIIRLLEEYPAIVQRYSLDLEKQCLEAITMIHKHHECAHRGAFLWLPGITAIFENRVYYQYALEIDQVRKELEKRKIEELAFSQPEKDHTWVILVRDSSVTQLDDLVWSLCSGYPDYIKTQRKIAFDQIWQFSLQPVKEIF